MAVNKNFVVKNGLEVGDTLIFASVADAKVGIGSTLPTIQLDVAGGIGATHINVSGVATITDSIRLGSGIAGTVFSALDNNLVGVGTSQPGFLLDVRSPGTGTTALYVQGDGKFTGDLNVNIGVFALNSNVTGFSTVNDIEINSDIYDIGGQTGSNQQVLISRGGSGLGVSWADLTTIPAGDATLLDGLDSTQFLRSDVADTKAGDTTFSNNAIFSSNVDIAGITTISGAIDGDSGANISGGETVLSSATVSDLTDNRVVIAGTSGALEDDSNLTFDGSTLALGASLDVNGTDHDINGAIALDHVTVSGITTVTGAIDGNGGANISGAETILSSATVSDLTDNRIVVAGTSGALEDSADLTFDGSSLTVNDADVDITGTGGLSIDGSTVIDSSGVWQGSSAGIQGIQGITGTQGTNGTQGTTGAQGTAGSNGSNGSNGTQGIQGIQGRQGTAGSNGSNGSNGTQGTQGIQGRQGTAGSNGSNGGTGAQGIQGRQGTTGSVSVSNNANNRVITATGGATANAEANLTFDGSNLVASGNITAYSDATVKDNIQTIEYALEKVLKLRGVEFDRNDLDGKPHQIGVIAQEIEKVIPEVVITNDDGLKSVAYGNLSGLLIEAIKELKAEIDELKSNQEG